MINLNGGWTADPERNKPGRDLGYTGLDTVAEALGSYAEYVEELEDIRPALQRAWRKGRGGHGRVCQRQNRLPRPRHDRALRQPRNLRHSWSTEGRFRANERRVGGGKS